MILTLNGIKVSSSNEFAFGKRNRTYGYPVEDVVRFEDPVPVNTPRGQNRKKNLTYSVIPNIDIEGSRYSLSRNPATFDEGTGLWVMVTLPPLGNPLIHIT